MHLWQDIVYAEVCHPEHGGSVPFGGEGVLVYTHLERTSQPMIRLWSGDLATWTDEPCECRRTYPRLPKGIYGRVDDMFIVRGENIYPSAIEELLRAVPGFGQEYRIIVSRRETMDELVVQAEYSEEIAAQSAARPELLDGLKRELRKRLRAVIGVWANIQLVPPGALPQTEFKARRVIDNRDLFRELLSQRETHI
jgi:phenylacetate-CoA ligase